MDNQIPTTPPTTVSPEKVTPPAPSPSTAPLPPLKTGFHHHFPFSRVLLIITGIAAILFIIAYAGTYYLLNQQLDKLTHVNQPVPTPTQSNPFPSPTVGFPIHTDASPTPITAICTQEAKLCTDGSYVGRTGPNCEFAQCPN